MCRGVLSSFARYPTLPRKDARRGWGTQGLFFDGGGFAFLDVVLVPGGDFGYVGSGFFDDALAAEAAVELQAGGQVEAV